MYRRSIEDIKTLHSENVNLGLVECSDTIAAANRLQADYRTNQKLLFSYIHIMITFITIALAFVSAPTSERILKLVVVF